MSVLNQRRHILPEMEGRTARWYARQRGTPAQIAVFRAQAAQVTAGARSGADILEVAPGPGYMAIEMSRLDSFKVTGLDISHTMVDIARENAAAAGASIDFRLGDVTTMPFADGSFDLIVCQAAFKNFLQPVTAFNEMHRVLRAGGTAVIQDMRHEATNADIASEVSSQKLSAFNSLITRVVLRRLRNRAFSTEQFQRLVAESQFRTCEISSAGIGVEVRLTKVATSR